MNYKESKEILQSIKVAKNILINCHRTPDPDSVGSALAMYHVLKKLNKEVVVVCPDEIPDDLMYLDGADKIEVINFGDYDFSSSDLFLILDSSSYDQVTGFKEVNLPNIKSIAIDHHKSNKKYADINLIDTSKPALAEILFSVFQDWDIEMNKKIANCLYAGILGDTGCFVFPTTRSSTYIVAGKLIDDGADHVETIFNLFRKVPIERMQMVGEMFRSAKVDRKHKFVWTAMDNKTFTKLSGDKGAKNLANALLFQNIQNTNFSVTMVEGEKNVLWVSLRSRIYGFDSSKVSIELGGGGHAVASGAEIKGMVFKDAVDMVLATARRYSK
jgi:phosphoesterase RecJ-like protein